MDRLLLIDDEKDVQYSFQRIFDSPQIEIATADSGEQGLAMIPEFKPHLVIMDVRMGGMSGLETLRRIREFDAKLPVIIMTAFGTTQTAIEAMKHGAYDYLLKPFDVPKLKQIIQDSLRSARDMKQVVSYQPLLESEDYDLGVVGRSAAMQEVFKLIGQVAGSDATALITGESGTGKELVARAIYHHSDRSAQPFIPINCAAIPENLLESELFGHEKNAFTGAQTQRIGKFEKCHGGTIFLDEIGDMSAQTQTKILRVLQSGEFERVGGNNPLKVDVRVIAATNMDLELAVSENRFREDLFYRLNVVRIKMPALRERRDDINLLINYFLTRLANESETKPKSLSQEAIDQLLAHDWPGNVRELENVIRRATVVAKGDAVLLRDLPKEIIEGTAASINEINQSKETNRPTSSPTDASDGADIASQSSEAANLDRLAEELFQWARHHSNLPLLPTIERELVRRALVVTEGNQVQASKLLGITRATLRKRIEKFEIRQEFSVS